MKCRCMGRAKFSLCTSCNIIKADRYVEESVRIMKLILLLLNLPFTVTGIFPLLLSVPYQFRLVTDPIAFVFNVKGFWWAFGYMRHARAMTIGHMILLGPKELENDFEHELIHVRQTEQYPFIFPFLYVYELMRNGYRMNRFEDEAYRLSNSVYLGEKKVEET